MNNEGAEVFEAIELSAPMKAVASAQEAFGKNYFNAFNSSCHLNNYAISPYSLATNLTMLANGADGQTCKEILAALGYEADQIQDANDLARLLQERLPLMDRKSTLKLANSIWTSPNTSLSPEFAQVMAKYFDAKTYNASMKDMGAKVNEWVKNSTDGKIKELLDEKGQYVWFVANTLYFNSKWAIPFTSDKEISFHNADGSTSKVTGMVGIQDSDMIEGDGFTIAKLKYGNGAFVMELIVPDEGVSLNEILKIYCRGELAGNRVHKTELTLTMPQFTVDFCDDIIPFVKTLGISSLFDEAKCDLSKMGKGFSVVDVMRQGAKLVVNKEGAELAAATASGETYWADASMVGKLTVDRPYAFVIKEKSTGAMLLAGKVTKL